jgi:hypothetical protein
MTLDAYERIDHKDVEGADPTHDYFRHRKTNVVFHLESQNTSGVSVQTYANTAYAAYQYAVLKLKASDQGMTVVAYKKSKTHAKAARETTSLAERVAALAEPERIRQLKLLEQEKQKQQKRRDTQDRRNEEKALALEVARLSVLGIHQRRRVKVKAAVKCAGAQAELADLGVAAMLKLDQETAEGSEDKDEEDSGGEEDSSGEHGDELSDAPPPTPLVQPAVEAPGNSPSIGVPVAPPITITALYPYASVGFDPFPPVVLPASPATRVGPARAVNGLVEASPALRPSPAISTPARSSSSPRSTPGSTPGSMVIAEQTLVSSLKARNAELEAKVAEEQTKSARLEQTVAQLCKKMQLRAEASEEKFEATTQLKNEAEARLYENESRADDSEKTLKDMQQTIDTLQSDRVKLKSWAKAIQAKSKEWEELANAAQAKQRVQTHAPPQIPSPKAKPVPRPR